jgi:hypothetical protein
MHMAELRYLPELDKLVREYLLFRQAVQMLRSGLAAAVSMT